MKDSATTPEQKDAVRAEPKSTPAAPSARRPLVSRQPVHLLGLQRSAGNRAVARLVVQLNGKEGQVDVSDGGSEDLEDSEDPEGYGEMARMFASSSTVLLPDEDEDLPTVRIHEEQAAVLHPSRRDRGPQPPAEVHAPDPAALSLLDQLPAIIDSVLGKFAPDQQYWTDHLPDLRMDLGWFKMEMELADAKRKVETLKRAPHVTAVDVNKLYKKVQAWNVVYYKHNRSGPKPLMGVRGGGKGEDTAAMQVVRGTADDRAAQLSVLLGTGKRSTGQTRFKTTIQLIGGDTASLEERYLSTAGRTIATDVRTTFGLDSLRTSFLEEMLSGGGASPAGRLALKIGLMREGRTPFTTMDKTRVADAVQANATEYSWLLPPPGHDPEYGGAFDLGNATATQRLRTACVAQIYGSRGSGFARELQMLVTGATQPEGETPRHTEIATAGTANEYLSSLVINPRGEFRNRRGSSGHTKKIKEKLLHWATTMADAEQRRGFVLAGTKYYGEKTTQTDRVTSKYDPFWYKVHAYKLISNVKAREVLSTVASMDIQDPSQGKLAELEGRLESQGKQWAITKRMSRDQMTATVKRFVSATGESDLMAAIIDRYGAGAKGSKAEQFRSAFEAFAPQLTRAGLSDDQVLQVRDFVQAGGSVGGETQVEAFVALKSKQRATPSGGQADSKKVADLLRSMAPGDHEMAKVKGDEDLMTWLFSVSLFADDVLVGNAIQEMMYQGGGVSDLRFWAAKLAASARIDRDGNRALEVCYLAAKAGISGRAIRGELKLRFRSVAASLADSSGSWSVHPGERTAYAAVKEFLTKGTTPKPEQLIAAAGGTTKFGTDDAAVDFVVDDLDSEQIVAMIDPTDRAKLVKLSQERFDLRLKAFEQREDDEQDDVEPHLLRLTKEIQDADVRITESIFVKLRRVKRTGEVGAIKRRLYKTLGVELAKGGEETGGMLLSPSELTLKGTQQQVRGDVLEGRNLESGVTWDHRSTIAAETALAMGDLLGAYRQHKGELASLHASPTLSDTDRAKRKRILTELKDAEEEVSDYQRLFRETQDRLNEQTLSIIMTIVGLVISIAGLASGVGASLGFIQLAWMIGSSILQSALKAALTAALSREGDFSGDVALKDAVVQLFGDVLGMVVTSELTLALDLAAIGIHTGGAAEQLFGKPALAVVKGQISSIIGDVPKAIEASLFSKNSKDWGTKARAALMDKLKQLPNDLIVGYFKGFATTGMQLGQSALWKELGATEASWTPSGGLGGNKYIELDKEGNLVESATGTTGKQTLFGGSGGGFGDFSQFQGGPTTSVGADVSAFQPGYDTSKLPGFLATSIKTVIYEEYVAEKLKGAVGATLGTGLSAVMGEQRGEAMEGPVTRPTTPAEERAAPHAMRLTIEYFAQIGLRLPSGLRDPEGLPGAVDRSILGKPGKQSEREALEKRAHRTKSYVLWVHQETGRQLRLGLTQAVVTR